MITLSGFIVGNFLYAFFFDGAMKDAVMMSVVQAITIVAYEILEK